MTVPTPHERGADRQLVLGYLTAQLIGPVDGPEEILGERPDRRYLSGILFPGEADADPILDGDIVDDMPAPLGEDLEEDPVALTGQLLPASVGLSFVTASWMPLRIEITAGRYLHHDDAWHRQPLQFTGDAALTVHAPAQPGRTSTTVPGADATIEAIWRRFGDGALVTVALVNRRALPQSGRIDPSDCLLQVTLSCTVPDGGIAPYPVAQQLHSDDEEEELALLYRNVPVFAIGHGAAAMWTADGQRATEVRTSYLPHHVVPDVAFDLPNVGDVLSLAALAGIVDKPAEVIALLDEFVDRYDEWAERLAAAPVPGHTQPVARRLLDRIGDVRRRMRDGVRLLVDDPEARYAFGLANTAMLMQMQRSAAPYAAVSRNWSDPIPPDADPADPRKRWRPFQLAFLLLTMRSVVDPACDERKLVDLIWFPTGGGKTEAYLGLVAFTIFHRRRTAGEAGAGTTVITRYTLRLLTAQQFQRAATLICACELIRRQRTDELGSRSISIGIWVGGGNSPNTYSEAVALLQQLQTDEFVTSSFQLEQCPWCGTVIIPKGDVPAAAWGITADNSSFRMHCPNAGCDFHARLPVSSVDEALYADPPTLLVATVDKFARFTWEPRAGSFLGAGTDPGPSLIIQDEFHLISGPLGTIVGLYEAAFDVAMARHGSTPKIVASTATIRRAATQSAGVFGRPIVLFPPSGVDADDSYFVRTNRAAPGRLYAGIMPQGHTPLTGMVHLSAALLNAPATLPLGPEAADAYWTLVAYHNSLRELGKTVTLAHDDIPARLQVIAATEDDVRALPDDSILELTSNIAPADIPRYLKRLFRPRGDADAVSFVASTNMISVGVDVSRLGLMLIVGQPKTTAEYIQASSRVGRSTPGLVVTLYSPSKPRDRSHYETFVPYHSALYRAVEPTSVTPFSVPARGRALHAGLVILARHAHTWRLDNAAADFDRDDPAWQAIVAQLAERAGAADPEELADVIIHLSQLQEEWAGLVDQANATGGLRYSSGGRESIQLLRKFGRPGPGWATLDSMRNVDTEVRLNIRGVRS